MDGFEIGAAATLAQLEGDPHALLAELREHEPVSWLPVLDGWLVTRRDLAMQVMRDAGDVHCRRPAILDRSGRRAEHAHARRRRAHAPPRPVRRPVPPRAGPRPLRRAGRRRDRAAARRDGAGRPGRAAARARRPAGRRGSSPHALGFDDADARAVLGWYDRIVAAVTEITAGRPLSDDGRDAYAALSAALGPALDREPSSSLLAAAAGAAGGLERERVISNAAVMLFGGIETTEGMIANAVLHLLAHPDQLALVKAEPDVAPERDRGVAAPRAGRGGHRPLRDRRRRASPARRSGAATSCASRSPRPTAIPPSSPTPTASTSRARTRAATWRSPTARMCASGCTSRGWRRTRRSSGCSGASRSSASTAPAQPRGLVFRKPPALEVRWT